MRNMIIIGLLAAIVAPSAVAAQSVGEVRRSQRELRQEQRELQQARRFGDRGDIRAERRDVRDAREELREDRRDMRRAGNGPGFYRQGYGQGYVAPYRGWNYRPVNVGFRLQPAFYGPRYVIANPIQYRLPVGRRNQQWIRYGNDLLLVNVRNGRVLQVIPGRLGYGF